jgi:hypothetical protein
MTRDGAVRTIRTPDGAEERTAQGRFDGDAVFRIWARHEVRRRDLAACLPLAAFSRYLRSTTGIRLRGSQSNAS